MSVRATARLQFHAGFPLDAAVPLVPYFRALGISHLYASPLLMSRPGSTHGYDIVDPTRIDPELGGEDALHRLVGALRSAGMGLILDIVPNHMGVGGSDNPWWQDVLEWGERSPWSRFFDIDWDPPDPTLRGKLLAPFLGTHYGEALDSGALDLTFDEAAGKFHVGYYEHRFPIAPASHGDVLAATGEPLLEGLAQTFRGLTFRGLGADAPVQAPRAAAELAFGMLARHAAEEGGRARIDTVLAAHRAAEPESRARLHALLERQHYRLAWWRAATDEINWRRFFDVTSLGGLRIEDPAVFEAVHATTLRLYAEGLVDGLRIDHVDGLADPRGYCRKLRRRLESLQPHRPADAQAGSALLLVEKILAGHERLRRDWMVDGTTGYEFMDLASAVLHDPDGEAPLDASWRRHTGSEADFAATAREARAHILRYNLASELNGAASLLKRMAEADLATRDFTLTAIRRALTQVLVHFPAYRTYVSPAGQSAEDRQLLDWAWARARRTVRATERPLLDRLDAWLGARPPRSLPRAQRGAAFRTAVRFQQLSAPVAAKSVEDTSFYRYGRLLSRNEVGSEPDHLATTPQAFHAANRERLRLFPRSMLSTATHDHKRGEDARARLAVLSELPEEWDAALLRWSRLNAPLRSLVEGEPAPDPVDEWMLYQSLLGAWPLDLDPDDEAGIEALLERLAGWQQKALREAKRHSDWAAPNEAYEAAAQGFLRAMLARDRASRMRSDVAGLVARLAPAGARNGLAQTLLRCTAPGIPDLYQGCEFWDFSLVDPDNRRPVDFERRAAVLEAGEPPDRLLGTWRDGRVKAAVLARTLAHRARRPERFAGGDYLPLQAEGALAGHVLAFARLGEASASVVVVTRLGARLENVADRPLVAPEAWGATALVLPETLQGLAFEDALTGARHEPGERLPLGRLLSALPVALLDSGD